MRYTASLFLSDQRLVYEVLHKPTDVTLALSVASTPSVQEEIAAKTARLQRVAAATETARHQAAGLAAECQAERERLLEDIRRLNAQMKQKVSGWV